MLTTVSVLACRQRARNGDESREWEMKRFTYEASTTWKLMTSSTTSDNSTLTQSNGLTTQRVCNICATVLFTCAEEETESICDRSFSLIMPVLWNLLPDYGRLALFVSLCGVFSFLVYLLQGTDTPIRWPYSLLTKHILPSQKQRLSAPRGIKSVLSDKDCSLPRT